MPGGRPSKYNSEMCKVLIEMMSQGCGPVEVCAKLGITKDTFYQWEKNNREFSDACSIARIHYEAWWEKQGRQNIDNGKFNSYLYYKNMINRFKWSDKQVNYDKDPQENTTYKIKDDDNKTHEIKF